MPPAGFEPAIPANERSQIHALDCAVTGIGVFSLVDLKTVNQLINKNNNIKIHCS